MGRDLATTPLVVLDLSVGSLDIAAPGDRAGHRGLLARTSIA